MMKILVISANYPPYHYGGYGLRLKEIVCGLAQKGHDLMVLTTKKPRRGRQSDSDNKILRKLHNRYEARFFLKEIFFDLLDTRTIDLVIKKFAPDLIYIGHTYPLTKQLLPFLDSTKKPLLYDEGGTGLKGVWTDHGHWFKFAGNFKSKIKIINLLKPMVIRITKLISYGRINENWIWPEKLQVIFNSKLNLNIAKALGIPVDDAKVIYSGVDVEKFWFKSHESFSSPLKIIIPGRIEEKKGQLDGVLLISELQKHGIKAVLTLVGASSNDSYSNLMKNEIKRLDLSNKVFIKQFSDQNELIDLLHESDICFFPSRQLAGLSRIPLEAMASGCLVISYGNEGSHEIIRNGSNGFLIECGNYYEFYKIIDDIKSSKGKLSEIINLARENVEQNFDLNNYIDQINFAVVG